MINIVLFEPEIAANVGNIARTCVGMNCILHMIKPYGFFMSDKKLKRAGIDYWKYLNIKEYDSFDDFLKYNNIQDNLYIISRYGKTTPNEINMKRKTVYFLFGKESTGLPEYIMKKYINNSIRIPSINVRSLNLSNCVAIISYIYNESNNFQGLDTSETINKKY